MCRRAISARRRKASRVADGLVLRFLPGVLGVFSQESRAASASQSRRPTLRMTSAMSWTVMRQFRCGGPSPRFPLEPTSFIFRSYAHRHAQTCSGFSAAHFSSVMFVDSRHLHILIVIEASINNAIHNSLPKRMAF
ncbi:hypothetical protein BJ166DRAFT_190661 [Pestalotiopsis sp. NC0098]|nr:hypothetical protein BJ166DRAFT_190661 [Pestalotiopsis sp. NC0098]